MAENQQGTIKETPSLGSFGLSDEVQTVGDVAVSRRQEIEVEDEGQEREEAELLDASNDLESGADDDLDAAGADNEEEDVDEEAEGDDSELSADDLKTEGPEPLSEQ